MKTLRILLLGIAVIPGRTHAAIRVRADEVD